MPKRPRGEEFFVRVAIDTHRPAPMSSMRIGTLLAFLAGDFGNWMVA